MKCPKGKGENPQNTKSDLFSKIQPFVAPYSEKRKKLAAAFNKTFRETELDNIQPETLSVIFWRIFGGESILWIDAPTAAGNDVPFDVMATAYAMWRDAQQVAFNRNLDSVDAAEAMTQVVHHIADRLADGNAPPIRNMRNYMFVSFSRVLEQINTNCEAVPCRKPNIQESDNGAFLTAVENVIMCDEVLSVLPPRLREMVIFRYMMGKSCNEVAAVFGSSRGAVRKAISAGIKKALGVCRRDLHKLGHAGITQRKKKQVKSK